ncbi:nucleotidyl transferase AbiEii/AbiGii toxin family protein [Streptomyces sp. NBC_00620]|uniref:nucleotidyl transferase AbiEii/AbiGii toxin family protein n=1 Tax=Streptomyces sp. NBC_00620 TaxID=2903666 RepID=UPI002252540B|nr:nucleotidyl transferase AbiEii/AbiGii toxin family protein [Streptomyces sp. NBC_00620]MCX4972406.1 nucleotidyl transferase AbiEii/AbiGii toxin family protein [Streptomyces sp. NBC_00620]
MKLTDLHRRLLTDVLAVGTPYPLALTGGYAVQAHGLVDRLSQDLDVATENPEAMETIAATLRAGLEQRGWQVRALETDPLSARLIVTDPASGEECEVDVLKEALWRPPVQTEYGLVLSLEDVVGTKVRALADRGLARDLIDVRAATDRWSHPGLEELGRRHARDTFDLTDLQARLAGADWIDDTEFAAYGLDDGAIAGLRQWAQEWADDIAERLLELADPNDE